MLFKPETQNSNYLFANLGNHYYNNPKDKDRERLSRSTLLMNYSV